MDRTTWKQQRRLWNEVQMDTIYARQYDAQWGGYINPSHRAMFERLHSLCPPGGSILDAACGTGKYWSMLLEHSFSVQGTDQSQQMLQQAHAKFPNIPIKQVGLQELTFSNTFDAIMCMDAMEMVFPEDWPVVLGNFRNALRENGLLYFTVEVESEEALQIAYDAGKRLNLPLIYGEYAHHGGYHYYPTDEQVRNWLADAHFTILHTMEGDGYWHYLTQK